MDSLVDAYMHTIAAMHMPVHITAWQYMEEYCMASVNSAVMM
ncbi:hypothetical protein FORC31_p280 (plasmid) [Escherichia coli]|nr:hypothetical protein FORC31_p280 [Escherichia coli]